jgi:hypothetical protein
VIAFSSRKQRITKKPDPPEQTAFDPLDPTNEPAQSAHEAEYVSASNTCKEIVWLEELLTELQCIDPESTPSLAMDNRPAIQTAFARGVLKGSRHIRARFHKMRAMAQAGELILEWLPSDQNLSDIFTKPLSKLPFRRLRDLILFTNDRDQPLQVASFALRLSHQPEQLPTFDSPSHALVSQALTLIRTALLPRDSLGQGGMLEQERSTVPEPPNKYFSGARKSPTNFFPWGSAFAFPFSIGYWLLRSIGLLGFGQSVLPATKRTRS